MSNLSQEKLIIQEDGELNLNYLTPSTSSNKRRLKRPISTKFAKKVAKVAPFRIDEKKITLSEKTKEELLKVQVSWEDVHLGEPDSLRYQNNTNGKDSIIKEFERLKNWNKYDEIAIDGMSGVGKTTLTQSLNRHTLKVNCCYPWITSGPSYNYSIEKTLAYITTQQYSKNTNVVWDRSCFSNIIFYIVHHIMAIYEDRFIPMNIKKIYPIITQLIHTCGLISVFRWMTLIKKTPTIIFVQSDFSLLAECLKKRSEPNDLILCNQLNYHKAQYHTYSYIAKLLDFPLFDVNHLNKHGYSINDTHELIKYYVDTDNTEFNLNIIKLSPNLLEDMEENTSLLYNYSKK